MKVRNPTIMAKKIELAIRLDVTDIDVGKKYLFTRLNRRNLRRV
jgi:hypothetical protein